MCDLTKPSTKPDAFNVLCHGDPWINNFLFSYDTEKKPNDVIFIDFQMSFWGTPAYDIYYFFVSSTQHHIKDNEFDNLIKFYHENLVENLKKMKYAKKIPTLREFHIHLMEKGSIAAILSFYILAIALLPTREDACIDNLMDKSDKSSELKRSMFNSPTYIKNLESLFLFLDKRGLLNI